MHVWENEDLGRFVLLLLFHLCLISRKIFNRRADSCIFTLLGKRVFRFDSSLRSVYLVPDIPFLTDLEKFCVRKFIYFVFQIAYKSKIRG